MNDTDFQKIWTSQDAKLNEVLTLNKTLVYEITRSKLNKTIGHMSRSKGLILLIGLPYTLFLYFATFIAYSAQAPFATFGFGAIALFMNIILATYFYHILLINQIKHNDKIVDVQSNLSKLRISSFNCLRIAILQLPFWSICWVSWTALKCSPYIYGGINLIVFLLLAYLAYWLYSTLSLLNSKSKLNQFFLSGSEWEPIIRSTEILEQLKELRE